MRLVLVVTDATAAPGRDALEAALTNFEFIAHETATTAEVEDRLTKRVGTRRDTHAAPPGKAIPGDRLFSGATCVGASPLHSRIVLSLAAEGSLSSSGHKVKLRREIVVFSSPPNPIAASVSLLSNAAQCETRVYRCCVSAVEEDEPSSHRTDMLAVSQASTAN